MNAVNTTRSYTIPLTHPEHILIAKRILEELKQRGYVNYYVIYIVDSEFQAYIGITPTQVAGAYAEINEAFWSESIRIEPTRPR